MVWGRSLQARLYLLVLLAVIPAIAAIVVYAFQDRRSSVAEASERLRQLAQAASFEYQLLVERERQYLTLLSQLSDIRAKPAVCSRFLASQISKFNHYLNLGVIGRDGMLRCSALPFRERTYLGDRVYFQEAIKSENFTAGDFQVGYVTNRPSINFSFPVLDNHGAPAAVIYSAVNLAWLNEFLAKAPVPDGASITVVDREGTVMVRRPDPSGYGIGSKLSDASLVRTLQGRPNGGAAQALGPNGTLYLYGFAALRHGSDRPSGYVLVGMPLVLANAEADRSLAINFAVLGVVFVLMLLVARAFGSRLILQPVRILSDAAERLGKGDLSARTHMPYTKTEFGQLAHTFDRMAEQLEKQVAEQRRDQERIRRLNRVYALLSRTDHAVAHRRDRATVFRDLCRIAVEEGGFRFAWVGWVDDTLRTVRPVAHYGQDESFLDSLAISLNPNVPEGLSPVAMAVRDERPHVSNDIASDTSLQPWREAARARNYGAWGAFPLRLQGAVVAVLSVHARDAGFFDDDEIRLLTEITSDISFALDTIEHETQRQEAEKCLKFLAYHDPITELPNLLHYDELLGDLLARARSENSTFALMIVALHRLDEVTATFGHHLQTELLRLIAQRLRQSVGVDDIVARGAGENFNIVLANADAEGATQTARHLIRIMEQPFTIEGLDIELGLAVGIALFPGHGEQLDALDRCAHAALTEARKAGGGYAFYTPGQDIFSAERLALVSELRQAIEGGQLVLVYQPKVDLLTGELAGAEALARWRHPARGIIMPDEFISVAEQTGLIRALTYFVIDAAAKQSYAFRRAGLSIPVAVNLSTLNLLDPRLPGRLQNQCLTWGVEPGAIELEITESAIMQDPAGAFQVLRRLNEAGYLLYIDDFGTGYSSLGYLKKLPVDALKIDQSFVLEMLSDKDAEQIVRSTIDLAHDLGLKVVAEGVESQEILEKLKSLGCDMAQGYHIGRPMDADKLIEWLMASPWRARRNAPIDQR